MKHLSKFTLFSINEGFTNKDEIKEILEDYLLELIDEGYENSKINLTSYVSPEDFQRLKNGEEIQMHPQTGEILKKAMRRTNFFIDLHQGTIAGDIGQYLIAFPTALGLVFLLISGLIIFPRRKSS